MHRNFEWRRQLAVRLEGAGCHTIERHNSVLGGMRLEQVRPMIIGQPKEYMQYILTFVFNRENPRRP